MMEIKIIDNDGIRLDKYLMEKLDVSRSKVQKLIDNENILERLTLIISANLIILCL